MGQKNGGLWDRVQGLYIRYVETLVIDEGKSKVRSLCDKAFDQCKDGDLLSLEKLPLATMLVYDGINKSFPPPHKDPPSLDEITNKIEEFRGKKKETLVKEEFHQLISNWIGKGLRMFLFNRITLALLAAPALTIITSNTGKQVPRVGHVVEKIPTPVLLSAYVVGLLAVQDVGM